MVFNICYFQNIRKAADIYHKLINPSHQQIAAFLLKIKGYNRCGEVNIKDKILLVLPNDNKPSRSLFI